MGFQLAAAGCLYLGSDFFTPTNTNSIVSMAHTFGLQAVAMGAGVLGYETTRVQAYAGAASEWKTAVGGYGALLVGLHLVDGLSILAIGPLIVASAASF